MSTEAFNLDAKIVISGIKKALTGLQSLNAEAENLASTLNGFSIKNVASSINSASKSAEKSIRRQKNEALDLNREILDGARERQKAAVDIARTELDALRRAKELGADRLRTEKNIAKTQRDAAVDAVASQRALTRASKDQKIQAARARKDQGNDTRSVKQRIADSQIDLWASKAKKQEQEAEASRLKDLAQRAARVADDGIEKAKKRADIERAAAEDISNFANEGIRTEKERLDLAKKHADINERYLSRKADLEKRSRDSHEQAHRDIDQGRINVPDWKDASKPLGPGSAPRNPADVKYDKMYKDELRKEGDKALRQRVREELANNGLLLSRDRNESSGKSLSTPKPDREAERIARENLAMTNKGISDKEKLENDAIKAAKKRQEERTRRRDQEALDIARDLDKYDTYGKDQKKQNAPLAERMRARQKDLADSGHDTDVLERMPKRLKEAKQGWTMLGGAISNTLGQLGAEIVQEFFQAFITGVRSAAQFTLEFEQALRNMNSLFKVSQPELDKISTQLTTMYERTGVGSNPVAGAESMRDLGALGYDDAAEAMKVTEESSILATATFTKQTTATQVLGGAMIGWGAKAAEARRYTNALTASTDLGRVTIDEYSTSLGRAAPQAVQMGVSIEEFTAMVGVATQGLLRGETAILGVGEALEKFSGSQRTKEASALLEKYNYQLDATTVKAKGPIKIIKELTELMKLHGDDVNKSWDTIAGSRSGSRAIKAMMGEGGDTSKLDVGLEKVQNFDVMGRIEEIMKGAMAQFDLFKGQVFEFIANLSKIVGPAFAALLAKLNGELKPSVDRIAASVTAMVEVFLGMLGMGGGNNLETALNNISEAIRMATSFMIGLRAVMTVAVNLTKIMGNAFTMLGSAIVGLGGTLGLLLSAVDNFMKGNFTQANADIELARNNITDSMNSIIQDGKDIGTAIGNIMNVGEQWGKDLSNADAIFAKHLDGLEAKRAAFADKMANTGSVLGSGVSLATAVTNAGASITGTGGVDLSALDKDPTRVHKVKKGGYGDRNSSRVDPAHPATQQAVSAEGHRQEQMGLAIQKRNAQIYAATHADVPLNSGSVTAGSAPKPGAKPPLRRDFDAEFASIKHQADVEKISGKEAIVKWESLLRYAKMMNSETGETNAALEDQRKIEKEIFDLKKAQAAVDKKASDDEKQAAKAKKKQRDDARVEHIRNVQGARAGDLAKLELDKQGKMAAGVPADELAAWEKSEKSRITTKHNEAAAKKGETAENKTIDERVKKLKFDAELAGAKGDRLGEARLQLQAEMAEYEKFEKDKTKIAEMYEAKRLQLEKDYADASEATKRDLLNRIAANEAELARGKGNFAEAERIEQESTNAQRYLDIKTQVEEWRRMGMSKIDIERFINSERLKILAETKKKEKAIEADLPTNAVTDNPADPRRIMGEGGKEGAGFSGINFSGINTGGGKKIQRTGHKWNKEAALAAQVAALSTATGGRSALSGASGIATSMGGVISGAASNLTDEHKNVMDINLNINGNPATKQTLTKANPKGDFNDSFNPGRFA